MISKNRLKELAAYRLQKRCDEEAAFVVEGPKMGGEALLAGLGIRAVCALPRWLEAHGTACQARGAEVHEVSPADLERLSLMKNPSLVWMLLDRPPAAPPPAAPQGLTLVLDRIQDPGNLGTMLRTADWFGVRHVVCSAGTVDCFNPKVVQASMGAVFRTAVSYTDLAAWLDGVRVPVYGASLRGLPLDPSRPPAAPAALVIGNESAGISDEVMRRVTHPLLIPNRGGTAESLNAAVAAGILMAWMCLGQ